MDAAVTIVGAGPTGLAVARQLQRLGIHATLLERDGVGSTWARAYPHLRLHTRKAAAALPGRRFPSGTPTFPSARDFHAYLRSYATHFGLDVREGVTVTRVERRDSSWHLTAPQGEWVTQTLVWAAGIWAAPVTPDIPGLHAFAGQLCHVRDYQGPAAYAGKRLLVVGAGNSGKDVATAALGVAAQVTLALRDGVVSVPYPNAISQWSGEVWRRLPRAWVDALLPLLRRAGADVLPAPKRPAGQVVAVVGLEWLAPLRDGRLEQRPALTALTTTGARFADGSDAPFDAVVLCTGFRPATALVDAWKGASNLHVVGAVYPTLETFLQQLRRESRAVAKQIARGVAATARGASGHQT
jgi:cation diffusion facilitator CzcD-associated flavoprotein CzcO